MFDRPKPGAVSPAFTRRGARPLRRPSGSDSIRVSDCFRLPPRDEVFGMTVGRLGEAVRSHRYHDRLRDRRLQGPSFYQGGRGVVMIRGDLLRHRAYRDPDALTKAEARLPRVQDDQALDRAHVA